jgi:hypothetical protein
MTSMELEIAMDSFYCESNLIDVHVCALKSV